MRGDWTDAIASLVSVADYRRDALDYRGMARALALAGGAAESAGRDAEAADLYLRASSRPQRALPATSSASLDLPVPLTPAKMTNGLVRSAAR